MSVSLCCFKSALSHTLTWCFLSWSVWSKNDCSHSHAWKIIVSAFLLAATCTEVTSKAHVYLLSLHPWEKSCGLITGLLCQHYVWPHISMAGGKKRKEQQYRTKGNADSSNILPLPRCQGHCAVPLRKEHCLSCRWWWAGVGGDNSWKGWHNTPEDALPCELQGNDVCNNSSD